MLMTTYANKVVIIETNVFKSYSIKVIIIIIVTETVVTTTTGALEPWCDSSQLQPGKPSRQHTPHPQ